MNIGPTAPPQQQDIERVRREIEKANGKLDKIIELLTRLLEDK